MAEGRSLYVGGNWVKGTGPRFESHNPANGECVWSGNEAGGAEVEGAVAAARHAFAKWAALHIEERSRCLKAFAEALKSAQQRLAEIISKEVGKPLWESKSEVAAMIQKVDISIEAQNQRCGTKAQGHPLGTLVTRHRPHGVVAVFGPFNFPGHLSNGHIVPALLAGNTVVLKPSEMAPFVTEEVVKCWEKAGLPDGVLNMVQGGREPGQQLAGHQDIDGLFFTGSYPTGLKISQSLAATPEKILALEMGGNNPLVVSGTPDIAAAVLTIIQSAFITSGQRCTCARRLIILEDIAQPLTEALIAAISKIKVGSYTDTPEPFMGPVVSLQAAKNILTAQQALIDKGGKPLAALKSLAPNTALLSPGLIDVTGVDGLTDEEIFGPLLQLVRVRTFSEAIVEAKKTAYGLAAGLISDSKEHYEVFRTSIKAGIINWNVPLTGASSAAPFGGVGHSGNHRPSAYYAADYCSYPVASIESPALAMPTTLPPGLS